MSEVVMMIPNTPTPTLIPNTPTPTPTLIPPLDLALAFVFVSLFFFLHSLQQCQQFIFRDLAAFPFPCAFRSAQVMGP